MSLLEQDTTRKGRVDDENMAKLDADDNSREYKVEIIWNNAFYARKSESGNLPGLYYLVSWKGYLEEKKTWKPASAVQHLGKLLSSFYKDHSNRLTATFPTIDIAAPMARSTDKLTEPCN